MIQNVEHFELQTDSGKHHNVQLKSRLDSLGIWATIKRFKKARAAGCSGQGQI